MDVGEFATVGGAVGSRMGGSAGTGAVTTLTDMVLAVQLRVGELDCEVCKVNAMEICQIWMVLVSVVTIDV